MLFSPYTSLTCVCTLEKRGKGALRGLVGNPGELAPLNQVRGLCTKSRLHGTKLCKALHCVCNTPTCANCTSSELVELCNSMRRKAMQGLFRCPELPQALSPKPTGTPLPLPLHPSPYHLLAPIFTCTHFSPRFHIFICTTWNSTSPSRPLCHLNLCHSPFH